MSSALEDLMVVEIAGAAAVPMAGRLLADWGADVIHIENPNTGDALRHVQASAGEVGTIGGGAATIALSDIPYVMLNYNRGKRSLTVDLSTEQGQEIVHRLLEKADVFLSNMRPYEMEKWNLKYDTVNRQNPGLIYASMNGYGQNGEERNAPGYDAIAAWSRTGASNLVQAEGFRPAFMDNVAGLCLAYGIMTALYMREKTGTGQEISLSLFQTGVFQISYDIAGALVTGKNYEEWGITSRENLPNVLALPYRTKDERIIRLSILQPDLYWSRFCSAIEREDLENDPRFESFVPRSENHAVLLEILDAVFLGKTLDEWRPRLNKAGIPWSPVQTLQEVVKDPQARANDFFVPLDHPAHGHVEVVANPIKLSKTSHTVKADPEFGQHTEEILLENGYTWDDIENFKQNKIIL
ncbi:MAG: CoA transferase [Deltaproteobacteria bacterium]|nr:CoA transferase [Deltaproteobacteria bacterium]